MSAPVVRSRGAATLLRSFSEDEAALCWVEVVAPSSDILDEIRRYLHAVIGRSRNPYFQAGLRIGLTRRYAILRGCLARVNVESCEAEKLGQAARLIAMASDAIVEGDDDVIADTLIAIAALDLN